MNFKTKEMKQRPDLNKLSNEIHEANKAKGFHDKEISNGTLLMLVITELSEAVEADRKGKRADYAKYQTYVDAKNYVDMKIAFEFCFKDTVDAKNYVDMNIAFEFCFKDTVEDELADAVIRLLDLAGLRGFYDLTYSVSDNKELFEIADKKCSGYSFPEIIYSVSATLFGSKDVSVKVKQSLLSIEWVCKHLNIDLWLHVELKMKYNSQRNHKHEKAY